VEPALFVWWPRNSIRGTRRGFFAFPELRRVAACAPTGAKNSAATDGARTCGFDGGGLS
jgi:hypothetical protein